MSNSKFVPNPADGNQAVYQLKIQIKDLHHHVWRRVLVPKRITFEDLHDIIQQSFRWAGYHLWEFRIGGGQCIVPASELNSTFDGEPEPFDAKLMRLDEYFTTTGKKCIYEYDFGDSWEHGILLEATLPIQEGTTYPRCIAGKRAGPPEDCGSFPGYEDLCEALKKAEGNRTEDEKELVEWVNELHPGYDPEQFAPPEYVFA